MDEEEDVEEGEVVSDMSDECGGKPPLLLRRRMPGSDEGSRRNCYTSATYELLGAASAVEVVNAIRRALMLDVPCLAFDKVNIQKYTGPLEREYIAHRIGQLPVSGYGSHSCGDGAEFRCDVVAPEEPPGVLTMVTSADFVLQRGSDGSAPLATLPWSDIDVVPLHPGQTCQLLARVQKSTCRQGGTRWQVVHPTVRLGQPSVVVIDTTGAIPPRRALWHALCALELRLRSICQPTARS